MAIIRMKEIRSLSDKELEEKLKELRTEFIKNNAQRASSQNTGKIKEIRRTIARINALLGEKQQKQ